MQIKNDYNLPWSNAKTARWAKAYINGDMGIIMRCGQRCAVCPDVWKSTTTAACCMILMHAAAELELAYAVTVHKSQGNEFTAVVMPMFPGRAAAELPKFAVYGHYTCEKRC